MAYLSEALSVNNELLVLSTTANGIHELDKNTSELHRIDGVDVRFFNRQTKDHTHLSLDLLSYLWNNGNKYDVVHIQSWWNLVAIFSALICKIRGWKYIISPRGMLSPYTYEASLIKKIIHTCIGNFLLKNAKIHLTSVDEQNKVLKLNVHYNTFVVPNFIDTSLPVIAKEQNNFFSLLFLGRIHPKKGLEVLFKSLLNVNFNYQLNIVGDGDPAYIKSLKELANKFNLSDKLNWLGAKHDLQKFKIYAQSDLMILPSQDENFANSVLESLLMGTPVLLSSNVGLSSFVKQHNLGWVYTGNENELSNALNNVYSFTEERKQIALTARDIVLKEFNHTKLINDYLSNYKS